MTTREDGLTAAPARYGVIGVGAIAEAIVTGLCAGQDDAPRVLLSPRGASRAAGLAERFPSVQVTADNQSVLDGARTIIVAVRPQDAVRALEPLTFRADHAVVSTMAGVGAAALQRLLAPATDIARSVPLPAVARRAGLTAIQPAGRAARELFTPLGGVLEPRDSEAFDSLSASTATIAAHFAYLHTIASWLTRHGLSREQASRYVAAVFAGAAVPLSEHDVELAVIEADHATPGGINERFRETLAAAGTWTTVARSLDEVLARLREDEALPGRR